MAHPYTYITALSILRYMTQVGGTEPLNYKHTLRPVTLLCFRRSRLHKSSTNFQRISNPVHSYYDAYLFQRMIYSITPAEH
jgi:hypothetical protein